MEEADGVEEVDGGGEGRHVEEMVDEMLEKEEVKVGGKVGTKKLKRIQEKAERKAAREVGIIMLLSSIHMTLLMIL